DPRRDRSVEGGTRGRRRGREEALVEHRARTRCRADGHRGDHGAHQGRRERAARPDAQAQAGAHLVSEDLKEASAAVVNGLYRLVKACLFHAGTNDAVTSSTAAAAQSVREYCRAASVERAIITFLGDAVFVNSQILKASRDVHALAAELGEMLATCEVS